MPRRLFLAIFAAALVVRAVTVGLLDNAGYLDAYYYQRVAENLAEGRGLVEDFAWIYLDDAPASAALPRPAHGYWMPLPTWLAFCGIALLGGVLSPFHAAAAPFVVLGALLPAVAAWLAWTLWQRRDHATAAGVLGIFASSYFARWVTPDTFTPFALAVTGAYVAGWRAQRGATWFWALAGAAAALAHLTRADGPIVLVVLMILALRCRRYLGVGLVLAGYVAVMGPWFARCLSIWGTLLPTAGTKTLWLTRYDEIWSYQLPLEPGRFWAQGVAAIAQQKLLATWGNALDALHVFQYIVLPLALVGGWVARRRARAALLAGFAAQALLATLALSWLFTFPSRYGSFFRSFAGLFPVMVALVPAGTEHAADVYAAWRGKDVPWMRRFLRRAVVGVACGASLAFFAQELRPRQGWGAVEPYNRRLDHYAELAAELDGEAPVMVVNPPGFRLATGRAAIAIPSDGASAIAAAADHYGARWLVVESNLPWLRAVWRDGAPLPGFRHVRRYADGMGSPVRLLERVRP